MAPEVRRRLNVTGHDGVTPVASRDMMLKGYMGQHLVVDISRYDVSDGRAVLHSDSGTSLQLPVRSLVRMMYGPTSHK